MTLAQRKKIEYEFFNCTTSENAWRIVFDNTLKKYKWDREERIMESLFIEQKKWYNICAELKIKKRTYYHYLNQIYETAFMWAKELNLL